MAGLSTYHGNEPVRIHEEHIPPVFGGCEGCAYDYFPTINGRVRMGMCGWADVIGGVSVRPACTVSGTIQGGEHGKPCEYYEAAEAASRKSA